MKKLSGKMKNKITSLYDPEVTVDSDGVVQFSGRANRPNGRFEVITPYTREDAEILQKRYDAAVCSGLPMSLT